MCAIPFITFSHLQVYHCFRATVLQERLTRTVAEAHRRSTGEPQEWVRMMLSTVGRGGDGQRIRDEILHIMHRSVWS